MRAIAVAKYLIAKSAKRHSPISNLKLQKLLYYSQAWHLAYEGKPLFTERIEAWIHGPVVPEVFRHYRDHRWNPITEAEMPDIPSATAQFLNAVLVAYGALSAAQLERLSHKEDPWLTARGSLPAYRPSTAEISHALMRNYFYQKLNA